MAFWMRKQAATIGAHLREQVSESLRSGSALGLASVAFIGVGREGLETALFLFASSEKSGAIVAVVGGSSAWRRPSALASPSTGGR